MSQSAWAGKWLSVFWVVRNLNRYILLSLSWLPSGLGQVSLQAEGDDSMKTPTQRLKCVNDTILLGQEWGWWLGSLQSMTAGVLNPLCAAPHPRPCYTNSQALTALRCHFVPFSKLLRGWAHTPSSLVLLDELQAAPGLDLLFHNLNITYVWPGSAQTYAFPVFCHSISNALHW